MIKSPLRYPGGKSKAVKFLSTIIKDCDSFFEPFAGGASLGIYISQVFNVPVYLNDINYDLYCFWKSALFNNEELETKVINYYNMPKTKEVYFKIIEKNFDNEIDIGARFFALNRITFSGTIESGGYSNQAHKKRFTESSISRMKEVKTLKKISISNLDYQDFLNNSFSEKSYVFLDPPYYSATKSALYGKNGELHKNFSHETLFNFLLKNKDKFKFFMTYDNCDYIKNLYKKYFYIYEWKLQYGMTNKKTESNNELLISNFEVNNDYFKKI